MYETKCDFGALLLKFKIYFEVNRRRFGQDWQPLDHVYVAYHSMHSGRSVACLKRKLLPEPHGPLCGSDLHFFALDQKQYTVGYAARPRTRGYCIAWCARLRPSICRYSLCPTTMGWPGWVGGKPSRYETTSLVVSYRDGLPAPTVTYPSTTV